MRGYTAGEVRAAEAPLLAAGVPLMARASGALADAVSAELSRLGVPLHEARVLLLVGSGDNGGDTLYAGALLAGRGADVDYVSLGDRIHREGEAAALAAGATRVDDAPDGPEFAAALAAADAVLDGVVGIGAQPGLREPARSAVAAARARVLAREGALPLAVAVDLPSGIHPDTGGVPDAEGVLPADLTVTFGACKAGLLRSPAAELAGRIHLVDIGLALEP
ncbi:NAD(P)H-hydrate epimerase [Protaetiibacter intestinalis]|uniref:NAD(P)H-hydrate epimerase n=1 Tax=Protaetiibacter intestinalis TaxID=2419774 RepID=A0A387B6B8_9MICO|nr:NAD(P)H-hydrate epimerase [Protaetiibacter intestinalis]AYF97893.1 NAD(P)H-hydrate epimerase [Protaetiibacter intestinalis]